MLTMRVTPKMSERPAATKKSPEAVESPLMAWKRRALAVIGAMNRNRLHLCPQAGRGRNPSRPSADSGGGAYPRVLALGGGPPPPSSPPRAGGAGAAPRLPPAGGGKKHR